MRKIDFDAGGDPEKDREIIDTFLANLRKSILDARAAGIPVSVRQDNRTEAIMDDFMFLGTTFTISIPLQLDDLRKGSTIMSGKYDAPHVVTQNLQSSR